MEIREICYATIIDGYAGSRAEQRAFVSAGQSYTYAELKAATDALAARLVHGGVRKGDHVALWAYNSANWVAAYLSIIKAGAVAVLLNYSSPEGDLAELLTFTNTKFLLYGNNRATKKDAGAAQRLAEAAGISAGNVHDFNTLCAEARAAGLSAGDAELVAELSAHDDPRRTAVIIFTTGTTALPKAVQLSQFSIINSALGFGEKLNGIKSRGTGVCDSLPLFHSFGLGVCTLYFATGFTVYFHEAIKADEIVRMVAEHHITDIASVCSVYLNLTEHPEFDIKIIPNVKLCLTGGGFSTPVQMMRLEAAFRHALFLNAYGQTESSPFLSCNIPEASIESRSNSVGEPLSNIELKIWTQEKGFLPTGETGEVVARGCVLMNGYYDLPPEKQSIDADGWLHTGDLGFLDEDGFLHLAGRIKDIIIKNGENISPIDVEREINKSDMVREAKVLGAPNPVTGESIEACIVPNTGRAFDEAALRAMLKRSLAPFKVPSHFFVYDKFPVNANGKLDQRTLKADMQKRLRALKSVEQLKDGVTAASVTVASAPYNIAPLLALVTSFARALQYREKRVTQIARSVETLLNERILNAPGDVGDITVSLRLMEEVLRVEFNDSGDKYFSGNGQDSGTAASTLLTFVDGFSIRQQRRGTRTYCMDFRYDSEFSAADFVAADAALRTAGN